MKFKLDENLGSRYARLFRDAGHDVETVLGETLGGAADQLIFETCAREHRALVSLDLDFADVLRFPPHRTSGIAVLRFPKSASVRLLELLVRDLLRMVEGYDIHARLWVVEPGRIRIHENTADRAE